MKRKLLIVDDEIIIREALAGIIDYEKLGYDVIGTAKNGMEAYEIICRENPDVVLTDIRMPVMDGLELIERTEKSNPDVWFIVLSGYDEFEYARRAMRYGVREYLLKPTDPEQLEKVLETYREEKEKKQEQEKKDQSRLLAEYRNAAELSFLKEGLDSEDIAAVRRQYRELFDGLSGWLNICYCYFVEEKMRKLFYTQFKRLIKDEHADVDFPALYVRNTLIVFTRLESGASEQQIRDGIMKFCEEKKVENPVIEFSQKQAQQGWQELFSKIRRFGWIDVIHREEDIVRLENRGSRSWNLARLQEMLKNAESNKVDEVLNELFETVQDDRMEAITLTMSVYLCINQMQGLGDLESIGAFYGDICRCVDGQEVKKRCRNLLIGRLGASCGRKTVSELIREYIEGHLNEENLSLRWLAENQLFMNAKYVSKLFAKENGEKFSDYLTRIRMQKAVHLMEVYRSDQVRDIAALVGYESNPRYFGQVFKKYYGKLPSEWMAQQRDETREG